MTTLTKQVPEKFEKEREETVRFLADKLYKLDKLSDIRASNDDKAKLLAETLEKLGLRIKTINEKLVFWYRF